MRRFLSAVRKARVISYCRRYGHATTMENRLTIRCVRCGAWWG